MPLSQTSRVGAAKRLIAWALGALVTFLVLRNAEAKELDLAIKRTKLDNGLRIVMLVDHRSPTVALDLVYDVGARNEERGRSGFAHLVHRLMVPGDPGVGRDGHAALVASRGGRVEGSANADQTSLAVVLPSHELALGIWFEADRFKALEISQRTLDAARAVVGEERRTTAAGWLRLDELAYQTYWPYAHPILGTPRDVESARLDWLRAFHDTYFAPNNAVLAIAGDFDEDEAIALAMKAFGGARPNAALPHYEPPPVPEQTSPRSVLLEDANATQHTLLFGWLVRRDETNLSDYAALTVAASVLGGEERSRLDRALRRGEGRGAGADASAHLEGRRDLDLFAIDVTLAPRAHADDVTKAVETQLADLARGGPTEDEIAFVRSRLRTRFLFGLQTSRARAASLATTELRRGDATRLEGDLARLVAVTREDVRRVVGKYLLPSRRSVVEIVPGEAR